MTDCDDNSGDAGENNDDAHNNDKDDTCVMMKVVMRTVTYNDAKYLCHFVKMNKNLARSLARSAQTTK